MAGEFEADVVHRIKTMWETGMDIDGTIVIRMGIPDRIKETDKLSISYKTIQRWAKHWCKPKKRKLPKPETTEKPSTLAKKLAKRKEELVRKREAKKIPKPIRPGPMVIPPSKLVAQLTQDAAKPLALNETDEERQHKAYMTGTYKAGVTALAALQEMLLAHSVAFERMKALLALPRTREVQAELTNLKPLVIEARDLQKIAGLASAFAVKTQVNIQTNINDDKAKGRKAPQVMTWEGGVIGPAPPLPIINDPDVDEEEQKPRLVAANDRGEHE